MPKTTWHVCHHCDGAGCEVCEEAGGWFETAAERDARLELAGWPRVNDGTYLKIPRTLCDPARAANSHPGPADRGAE